MAAGGFTADRFKQAFVTRPTTRGSNSAEAGFNKFATSKKTRQTTGSVDAARCTRARYQLIESVPTGFEPVTPANAKSLPDAIIQGVSMTAPPDGRMRARVPPAMCTPRDTYRAR